MPDHGDPAVRPVNGTEPARSAGDNSVRPVGGPDDNAARSVGGLDDNAARSAGGPGDDVARLAEDRGDEAFRALADPTRRRMLDLLAERGTLSVGELAAEFPDLVFSGISKHLMALRAAGLVTATKQGRKQLYRIDERGFAAALAPWVARYETYWSTALTTLRGLAESDADPDQPDPGR
jgi:DNA-binding transcriptional ArsR family regulator